MNPFEAANHYISKASQIIAELLPHPDKKAPFSQSETVSSHFLFLPMFHAGGIRSCEIECCHMPT
jgi:hypothetical protein